ncbi:ABC transporter ATP-binding protein [Ruminococcaceae bacterium OttesenSCG-928-L11]|nr:ABC transporter ATP-binding protein [Ruminococcaceae bacterium OttesenSCG-928-L11]
MSPTLQAENLTVGYGRNPVVNGASFAVGPGEFCALLGLNGCGKSTLLKTMCGLIPALEGRCLVNGEDIAAHNERKRARLLAYIPQRTSAMQGITALDVVCMGFNPRLSLLQAVPAGAREQAAAALDRLGVGALAGREFSWLSEGQKQLVVLARALVQDTPAMLLDEPDSALDFTNRHRILNTIRQVSRREKRAVLITLHDPNLALAYCDRLILLHRGQPAGELLPAQTEAAEIGKVLSGIYGELAVASLGGHPHVWMQPGDA